MTRGSKSWAPPGSWSSSDRSRFGAAKSAAPERSNVARWTFTAATWFVIPSAPVGSPGDAPRRSGTPSNAPGASTIGARVRADAAPPTPVRIGRSWLPGRTRCGIGVVLGPPLGPARPMPATCVLDPARGLVHAGAGRDDRAEASPGPGRVQRARPRLALGPRLGGAARRRLHAG